MGDEIMSERDLPDYEILSGGGDLFSPEADPVAFRQLVAFITERTEEAK